MSRIDLSVIAEAPSLPEDFDTSYIDHPLAKYTPETKIKFVGVFFETGSVNAASDSCGVPRDLGHHWKKDSPWFDETLAALRREKQKELDAVLTQAIQKSLASVIDRIEDGDFFHDVKTGEIKRIPMKGKELAVTLAVLYDKRALLRGDATQIKQESKATLQSLEDKFKQFALTLKEKDVVSNQ
jgi:hypothetical protein